jgi:lysophospholipase L1-like esterase
VLSAQSFAHSLKQALKNLAALLIGLTAAFVLAEIVLSWLVPPPLHYIYPQAQLLKDSQLGWIMRPGQDTFTIDKRVTTNSLGFRSPEPDPRRNAKGLRVVCLGDSQTFGNGVSQDDTYPAQLQALLASRNPEAGAAVINTGVRGYSTTQEVDLLFRIAPQLSPHVVTLGFYLNDIGEVLRKSLDILDESGEEQRRGFKRLTPYRLIYLMKRSRLVTLVYWRFRMLHAETEGNPAYQVLLGNTPPEFEESWRRIEEDLSRARDLARERGFRLIVFPVPEGQEFREECPREQYRSRFNALAERLGIDHFDPTPRMKALGGGFDRYFIIWDGHINPRTHGLIAESLYGMLAPSLSAARAAQPGASR